jgi:hypothetical protein
LRATGIDVRFVPKADIGYCAVTVALRFRYASLCSSVQLKIETPLQGDDYLLEYYEDGDPKLPLCLDRRPAAGTTFYFGLSDNGVTDKSGK